MPQSPLASNVAVRPNGSGTRYAPLQQDSSGNTLTGIGNAGSLNITAARVVKATAGRAARVSVIVAGSAVGSINDSTTTAGAVTANTIFVVPNTVGTYSIDWPCANGIVAVPGTGQTLAVSYV
jgi:hypothetical protein